VPNIPLEHLEKTLRDALDRKTYRVIDFFEPYPKQQAFFDAGVGYKERLLMAGTQLGKTYAGAFEVACHLTGEYPDWWLGRRWDRPVKGWAVGLTSQVARDVSQKYLCGEPGVLESHGTGMIPKERFHDKPTLGKGVSDAYDTIQVEHRTNGVMDGISVLRFKSCEQGRQKLQGESIDFAWVDEEPAAPEYHEIVARLTATKGMLFMTFTPLMGMSVVVKRFLDKEVPSGHVTRMTINDALHIRPEERAAVIAGYAEHEREARANGTPMLGSGLIYPFADEQLREPALAEVPLHWFKLWGIDFGIGHAFGAVLMAEDRDSGVLHILHTIKMKGMSAMHHAKAMKMVAEHVPVAWPHDGHQHDKGSGKQLAAQYKAEGLRMLDHHATWPDGTNSVEPGIMKLYNRMATGKLKVAGHLSDWFEERRLYHRKDGHIVKAWDDLMDPTRYGEMMLRHARQVQLGAGGRPLRRKAAIADGVDFDYFSA
jgi:phage terminase large subunit-like protein